MYVVVGGEGEWRELENFESYSLEICLPCGYYIILSLVPPKIFLFLYLRVRINNVKKSLYALGIMHFVLFGSLLYKRSLHLLKKAWPQKAREINKTN